MRQTVIVCGCPRSGTTALAMLLNHHPEVCIGIERFSRLILSGAPPADLFTPKRFKDVRLGDTFHEGFRAEERGLGLPDKVDTASVVGDKVPLAYLHYDALSKTFPGVRFVFIVRRLDAVAASYKRRHLDPADRDWRAGGVSEAIRDWNNALAETAYWRRRMPILTVSYEALFERGEHIGRVAAFLNVEAAPLRLPLANRMARCRQLADQRTEVLTTPERASISANAERGLYDALLGADQAVPSRAMQIVD